MVIDTSALVAILQDEPERRAFNEAIDAAEGCAMSVASFVETSMIIESRYGPDGIRRSITSSVRDYKACPVLLDGSRLPRWPAVSCASRRPRWQVA